MRLRRRDFLRAIVVTAAPLPACSGGDDSETPITYSTDPADVLAVYPQGVASGDPKPDSVVLWTRAVPRAGGPVKVIYEVALDEAFTQMVARGDATVDDSSDWTVRIKPVGLQPFTQYYYRFKADRVQSDVGRTKTAPSADQDVNVRFAFASCQDFIGRYYHAWRALMDEAPVDFVLFLGDYIYETNGDPDFQLTDPTRAIEIPDGISLEEGTDAKAATSLRDYRGLYQQYRSDENLKKAHQSYAFICIWDDHEFANDAWQDHATDFNEAKGDEKSTERRENANQAWFEYQPAYVEWDEAATFPNDLKIYRTLRYGKHVELVLTDQRAYRSDHVIPEAADPSDKPAGAPDYLTYFTAGKLTANAELGSRNFCKKTGTDGSGNPTGFDAIEAIVKPTMLGSEQKSWLIETLKASTATWKIWGNETQLLQMALDLSVFPLPPLFKGIYYFTVDQWDGYRSERAEILGQLAGVQNLVALTGDIHAFYAGELHLDFDNPGATPIGVEYVTAGISSSPVQEITQNVVDNNQALQDYGLADLVPQFDQILQSSNPHYKYAKSFAHGISVIDVSAAEIKVTFLNIPDVKTKDWDGSVERASFVTTSGSNRVTAA